LTTLGAWFFGLLFLGVPIAFVLAIAATAYLLTIGGLPLSAVPQRFFAGLDQFVLMSIPFFILSGALMNEAQLTGRLVQFANFLVGRWRGGLAQVNVLTSMFFGGITGAATADVAAIGPILIPAMVQQGYRREFATAVTVAGSLCGPLIPPSIPMLVYGVASGTSIGALFLAGATPGVAVGLALLALNRYLLRNNTQIQGPPPSQAAASWAVRRRDFIASFRLALVALLMPIIIVGGVVGGVTTPTEASVVAVLYAAVVGFTTRKLSIRVMWKMIGAAALMSATIMLIVAAANLLGWVLAFEQVPQAVAGAFLALTDKGWVFLLLVVVLLLVVGLFMETSGSIIILTPVLFPAAQAYGFDAVHFGVVLVFGLVIGLMTPPVGLCLFIGSSIGNVTVMQLSRALVPFIVVVLLVYLVFVFVPAASLWLPHLLMK
jgi:tripartite ATP-independent transporter DctM subunit